MVGGGHILGGGVGVGGHEMAGDKAGIRVAAGGHRDVEPGEGEGAPLARRIRQMLATIAGTAQGQPSLVVSLAEGADRIFVAEALAFGWPVTAVLPFGRAEFAHDFATAASRRAYQEILAQATDVIELPGARRGDGDGAAYAAANDVMLDRADVLLTVWDGLPVRGPGGTAEVVDQARARGLPVVWIAATPPHGIRLLGPGDRHNPPAWFRRLAAELNRPETAPGTVE